MAVNVEISPCDSSRASVARTLLSAVMRTSENNAPGQESLSTNALANGPDRMYVHGS